MGFLTAAHSRSIWTACQLLVPYVDACPACADNLVHSGQGYRQGATGQRRQAFGLSYATGEGEAREEAERAHPEAPHDSTLELLRQGNAQHVYNHPS